MNKPKELTPEEIQVRVDQLHAAVVDALRELIVLRPDSKTGHEAALTALGYSL